MASALVVVGFLMEEKYSVQIHKASGFVLFGPVIYVLVYAAFRSVYKLIYNVEPTYVRHEWYDKEEGRRVTWLDLIVYIIPWVLSFIVPMLIHSAYK